MIEINLKEAKEIILYFAGNEIEYIIRVLGLDHPYDSVGDGVTVRDLQEACNMIEKEGVLE